MERIELEIKGLELTELENTPINKQNNHLSTFRPPGLKSNKTAAK